MDYGVLQKVKLMGDRKDIPLPNSSYELIIICVNTSHPGNLGAICRTMLNYGFSKLRLVTPKCEPLDEEARNRAKHAGSILENLDTFNSLEDAVKDCSIVVGTLVREKLVLKLRSDIFVSHGNCLKDLMIILVKLL